jgi:hypothetical protein
MATPWRTLVVPAVLAVALAACGSDNSTSSASSATTVVPASSGTAPSPARTGDVPAPVTSGIPGAGDEIIVHVGLDDAATKGSRVETVNLNEDVVLRLGSDGDENYHVEGYNLAQKVAAGVEAQFEFKANKAGDFKVSSQVTDKVYVVLHVA